MTYRLLEHTADVGIEATGADAGATLCEAARGLTHVLTGGGLHDHGRDGRSERAFFVEAPDRESLLVAFLSELLWLLESDGVLWAGGGVRLSDTTDGLRAEAGGNFVRFDPRRHGGGVEVKAVTYHDVRFGPDGEGWVARVILDL